MKITIIGTGYVGLVAGACFADMGNTVVCVDRDEDKIAKLRTGQIPIYEPGLEQMVRANMTRGCLGFSPRPDAVADSDVVFLAVGTPPAEDGSADLSHLLSAAQGVAVHLAEAPRRPRIIVNKSTVPVGTARRVEGILADVGVTDCAVASNPEFLKEGSALADFMWPDRVVIGTRSPAAAQTLARLYAPFMRSRDRLIVTDPESAELSKYACNAYLASRVSFMNELANLCEKVGADVEMVRRTMGSDERIGSRFLYPGIGFGGSCFPKDVRALLRTASEHDAPLEVAHAALRANTRQKARLAGKVLEHFGGQLVGKTIAVWGLAFKPETDDVRESPALELVRTLARAGARANLHDPQATENARAALRDVPAAAFFDSAYGAAQGADALCLCTEWREYRQPSFEHLRSVMRGTALFDGRNAWEPAEARGFGFTWTGIGRP